MTGGPGWPEPVSPGPGRRDRTPPRRRGLARRRHRPACLAVPPRAAAWHGAGGDFRASQINTRLGLRQNMMQLEAIDLSVISVKSFILLSSIHFSALDLTDSNEIQISSERSCDSSAVFDKEVYMIFHLENEMVMNILASVDAQFYTVCSYIYHTSTL